MPVAYDANRRDIQILFRTATRPVDGSSGDTIPSRLHTERSLLPGMTRAGNIMGSKRIRWTVGEHCANNTESAAESSHVTRRHLSPGCSEYMRGSEQKIGAD